MIFSLDQLEAHDSVFHGRGGNPLDWSSTLPDLSVFGFSADPALGADLWSGGLVAQLAMRNVASALRLAVGRVAITQGFAAKQLPALSGLFGDSLETLYGGVDVAARILGSDGFSLALDALGWIPVAGWILDLVVSVVELVVDLVEAVGDLRERKAREALARVATVPLAQWSRGADEVLARTMMLRLGEHDAQWVVSPRYPATSAADLSATPQVVSPGDDRWAGWVVHSGGLGPGGEGSPGLGFVPGSRNLHGAMELRTRGARDLRDLGQFYPTARLAAVQWWEMVVAGGPSMFSVDASAASADWEDYVRSAVEFGDNKLSGWSTSKTATSFEATQHLCIPELYGVDQCRKSRRNALVPMLGTGHRSAYLEYLFALFDPQRRDPERGWDRDNIDWADTVPGRALANLEERQDAALQSLACMTVDDSEVDGRPRFRAIGTATRQGPLWQRWYESVSAVFQTGEWRNVKFDDIPEGALKAEVRERCAATGIDCTTLGKQHETSFAPAPSSLGDPVPPTPPNPIEVQLGTLTAGPSPPTKHPHQRKRSVGALPLAAGVLGGLVALTNNR